jgi:uncharacterized protein (TIGR02118 family)
MIRVAILYPNSEGAEFDMDYYMSKHLPLAQAKTGCTSFGADLGLSGGAPGVKAPYIAIGYLTYESLEHFQSSFSRGGDEVRADMVNYTNVKPIVQISETRP